MSGNSLFVDTNIILYLLNGDEDVKQYLQGNDIYISIISEMELLSFPEISENELKEIVKLLKQVKIIDINYAVKQNAINFRRKYKIKLPDSIVLATAKYLELPILTADKQLSKVEEEIDVIIYKP
ncbi:type II toxin-antitoxin system VapC family toxin [Flavobacterium sp. PLA-1-15]|uniref:type II toxin-antitoxin system VapC family toxin n=1 Tax=Flavobacterium sp. PLA-1-15 TaxID=3380533 RepID=UPI003B7D34C2